MQAALNHLKADPVLHAIIERVGDYTIQFREPTFESLVRSIVFQQLSGRVATVIFNRLAAAVPDGRLTPENIMKLRPERMRKLGLSGQKTAYIRDLAKHVKRGKVSFAELPRMADEDVIEHLTQVKGIGVWTAHMFLMFALQRHNVLPTGDLGIRSAIRKAYGMDELPTVAEVEKLAAGWHPYCSIACWYLWRSLEKI
ncbi:MAG: DNA-3-methyladenine glycosylase [Acidobacteriota bacterium]|nr:DNA-3-methyladenine glycosylase [Acidobacteriota bacterium]